MFPNNLDSVRYPLRSRLHGILAGTAVMVAGALALVTPATLDVTMPASLALLLCVAYSRGTLVALKPSYGAGSVVAAILVAFAILSAAWSSHPRAAAFWSVQLALVFAGAGIAMRYFLMETRPNIFHISEGLWIGLLAGLAYLFIEIVTHQGIKLNLYRVLELTPADLRPHHHFKWDGGFLKSIDAADLTRNIAPIPLYIWAVLLAIRGTTSASIMRLTQFFAFLLAAAVTIISENETAKLALIAGTMLFVLAKYRPLWARRILQASWVIACILIVPLSLGMYRLNLHNSPWVQPTAQHRIIIWNRVSEEVMKSPLTGIGAGMTYWNYDDAKTRRDGEMYSRFSRDAHNVFLQTWFELGIVGAILLALIGLALLERIRRLAGSISPYAYATFTSASVTLAASWGMWRTWFTYMFALSAVMFAIGIRATIRSESVPGLEIKPR